MDAISETHAEHRVDRVDRLGAVCPEELRVVSRLASVLTFFLSTSIATGLALRRSVGVIHEPLRWQAMWAAGGTVLMAAVLAYQPWRHVGSSRGLQLATLMRAVWPLAIFGFGISLTIPGSGWLGPLGVWSCAVCLTAWMLMTPPRLISGAGGDTLRRGTPSTRPAGRPSDGRRPAVVDGVESEDAEALPQGIDQQLTRGTNPDQTPFIAGRVRVAFEPQQRLAYCHVVLCPPLERAIDIQLEQLSGPMAEIRIGLLLPQGVRLEVRPVDPPQSRCEVVVAYYGELGESASDEMQITQRESS